jgi:hypothetical protein
MTAARTSDDFRSDVADYTLSKNFGTADGGGRPDSHWPYAKKAGASLLMTGVAVFGVMGTSMGAAASKTDRGVLTPSSPTRTLRLVPPLPGSVDSRSDREEISWIKESSGLTWDQLGKVFGVSRRAVHMWANGGRLNESNARRVREFSAIVRSIQAESPDPSPDIVRGRLLQVEADGLSTIDRLRRDQSSGATWGMPFGPERLVGALRDPLRAPVGEIGQ